MSHNKIRLGIVGLGAMGSEMLDAATDHPDVTVAIAADVSEDIVESRRRDRPGIRFTTRPDDVTASADLNAVYVATPPAVHARLVLASLRDHKAVFCEKPLAISLAEGKRMVVAADASGLACAVNFALSDRNAVLEVERALHAGECGQVIGVDVRLHFPRWPRDFQAEAGWLATRAQGGFLREVFSHFAYLTDRLLGPLTPVHVDVDHTADVGEAETAAHGFLRAGDVPVQLSALSGVGGPESYEWVMWGSRRSYLLRDWGQLFMTEGQGWAPVDLSSDRGSEASRLSLFARAVRGEQVDNLADFAAAYRVQEVVEAFHHQEP